MLYITGYNLQMQRGGYMAARRFLTAVVLALILCAPSEALSEESDSGSDSMRGSLSLGFNKVEDANSFTFELDFTFEHLLIGGGAFWIDNGNLPSGLVDSPPNPGVNTIDVGKFRDNETGAYLKVGGVLSGLRAFGILGASSVANKYIVKSTQSDIHYITEEETGDYKFIYGGGIGYLLFDRLLLQYQYDNRRKDLILVGISF
jgi:hypothetical protein